MSVPEGIGSGASPGLFASLRSFWSVLVAILYTRLDLATAELEDEAIRGLKLVAAGLAALLCIGMTIFFILFFLVVTFWDNRVLLLGIISGVSVLASVVLVLVARNMILNRPKFLSQTLAELRRDVEGLRRAVATKKDEANP
jgi:uncharacterized membrane protein YqjE